MSNGKVTIIHFIVRLTKKKKKQSIVIMAIISVIITTSTSVIIFIADILVIYKMNQYFH